MDNKIVIRKCSRCKEIGHSAKTCSKKKNDDEMDFISQISNLGMVWHIGCELMRENGKLIRLYDVYLDLESYKKSNYDEKFNILNNPNFTFIDTEEPIIRYDISYGAACYEKKRFNIIF